MENNKSIILKINLNGNCEGRKWTIRLLKSGSEYYDCLKNKGISPEKLYHGMKAFIRLDGELKYNNSVYKDIQILCKIINPDLREVSIDPVVIKLAERFDKSRVNDRDLQSIGIDLSVGNRIFRYTNRGDEILKMLLERI